MADTNPEIRLVQPPTEKIWDKLEGWHKIAIVLGGCICFLFGLGAATEKIKGEIVLQDAQRAVDEAQNQQIRAVTDDAGRIHITLDDLHDEVRGMRTDLRFFDPRLRGGGLPNLPEETPRPTPPLADPSMGFRLTAPKPSPSATKGTP